MSTKTSACPDPGHQVLLPALQARPLPSVHYSLLLSHCPRPLPIQDPPPINPPCSASLGSKTLHEQADSQGAGPLCHFHGDVITPPCGTFVSLHVYLGSGVKMAVVVTDAMVGPQWSDCCAKTFRSWVGESISEKGSISVHLGPRLALSARTGLGVSLIALTVSLHQTGESPLAHPAGTTHWSQQGNGLSTGQEAAGK